jgi:eukaryotic-like serine/threonine-protein kinase
VALAAAMRLGPYEIVAPVGAGGMGEVYRARDTRLGRMVAIKVIGSSHPDQPEMRRRFEEEARLAAQLDHPRIGAVYDVGHEGGIDYFVMEFIEGRRLSDRIADARLPFTEMIGYAIEIASGLAYAHRRGVEHRDLKPGNVLLTPSGIKIIDFGLGRLRRADRRPSDRTAAMKTSPRLATDPLSVPGTAGYMPPERLQGLPADHRSDIFAFGALLYEMAAGRRAFDAATPADLVAAILTADPPPLAGPEPALSDVDWVIRRCLKKLPDERWQSMADVEAVLKRIASAHLTPPKDDRRRPALRASRIVPVAIGVALALAGVAFLTRRMSAPTEDGPLRAVALTVTPPPGAEFTPTESSVQAPQLTVSPDGRYLAFVASGADGVSQIWLRPLDSALVRPIPGTAHATYPFWSASSRSIGFFTTDGLLKRVDIDGGPARTLAAAPNGRGGTWSADDVILFSPGTSDAIHRVRADGGVVRQTVLAAARRETSHRWPQFLPDGHHFIYFARSVDDNLSTICLGSLDAPGAAVVIQTGFGAVFAPPGHLLYVSDGALLATDFDVAQGRVTGEPVPVIDRVATSSSFYGAFSASNDGVLAWATPASMGELVWTGRDGRRLDNAAGPGGYVDFALSPDSRYLAVAEVEPHSDRSDLRLIDLLRGANLRLTTSPATDASPVWSPDSARIIFRSNRDRRHDLYIRPATGGEDQLFLQTDAAKYPTDWSPDGAFVVYHTNDARTKQDIWAAPLDRPEQARPLVRTEFDEMQGQISPSGRWLAYTSNQSSRLEVYVQPLQPDGRKWQISTGGGSDPKWRADEKELFYVARDGRLMSVELPANGFVPGNPRPLFPVSDVALIAPFLSAYDVHRDGQRFVVRVPSENLQTHPLNVLVHWSLDRKTR